jgi:signal transduction histidine kinase/ActR/RegA family two-component response regulator
VGRGGIVSEPVRFDEAPKRSAAVARDLVFDQAPVACLLLSVDLTITAATDRYLAATMTTREGIVGLNLFEAFPDNPDEVDATGTSNVAASLERVVRTKRADSMSIQKYDVRRPGDEGGRFETRYWSAVNSPVLDADGELVGIIHRVEDVTELVDLRASVGERGGAVGATPLEEELFLRRREQDLANARLIEADRVRREFLSQMSHELRTPLNAVVGFGQLLEMGELDERQQKAVHNILRSSRHLLGLIDEILDFAQVEASSMTMSIEPVMVGDLIAQGLDMIGPAAAHRDIELVVALPDCDVSVAADRQRALQVLLNLLSNAVKYTHSGGTVEIAVAVNRSKVQMMVVDDGPGIAPDVRGRLFAPFDRLGMEQTDIEGSGVGLALARSLAERMGGTLELARSGTDGSVFVFELPAAVLVAPDPAELAFEQPSAAPSDAPVTVLYVEDNLANVRLVETVVETMTGVKLLTALQGGIGVDLAAEHQPDLVLLDVHLPDIDGEEVLARLRSDPRTAGLRIVFLSADATKDRIERFLASSADGHLTKPIEIGDLIRAIDAARPPRPRG